MNDLLKLAVEAHGGLARWKKAASLEANISVTGALWHLKGKPDFLKDIHVEAKLHEQKMTTWISGQKTRLTFNKGNVAIETEAGEVVESREEGRLAFAGQSSQTPWDDLHVAYFNSYALWTYLTIPFVYTGSGFITEELAPWHESGKEWRPLKVRFPNSVVTHTREQVSYFGKDGLLRRHEYSVDVLGGASGLNYAYEYRDFGGIKVPTKRRVYAASAQKQKILEPLLVGIDINDLEFKT
jgi:hypothetical protein